VEIDINSKTLTDTVTLGSSTIPDIIDDLNDELTSLKSTATIGAFDETLTLPLVAEAWNQLGFGNNDELDGTYANSIICAVIGGLGGVMLGLVCGIICVMVLANES